MSEKTSKVLYLIMLFIVSALVRNGIDNYFREKEKAERKREVKKMEQIEVKSKDIMGYEGYIDISENELYLNIYNG